MDVDGVLTDGGIYIDQKGNQNLRFDVKDGLGIKILQKYNFVIALISGGEAKAINKRAEMLDINLIKTKVKNKFIALKDIQQELNVTKDETVFLGDDINDLSVLPLVSMFLVPENAHKACIKNIFDKVSLLQKQGSLLVKDINFIRNEIDHFGSNHLL